MSGDGTSGVVVRRESGLPAYRQLVDQFRYLIGAGRYPGGSYLPTMREVAAELGLNLNTVNRAYRQLQRDGLIRSTPGKGARVIAQASRTSAASTPPPVDAAVLEQVNAILAAAIERALSAGMAPAAISVRVDEIVAGFTERVPPPPRVGLSAGCVWRSRELATRLGSVIGRDVVAVEEDESTDPLALVVRPRYGAWSPDVGEGERDVPVIDLPVVADRDAIRRLVLAEPGSNVCAVGGDEAVARWLGETATMLGPTSLRWIVASDVSSVARAAGELLVVEEGMPGAISSDDVFVVSATFVPSVASDVDRALGL